jgi:uncharacterized protein YqfB (UPF0267 family)
MDFWETIVIHAVLGILQLTIKNPQKAAQLKTTLLQVRDTINEIYPGS